MNTDPLYAHKPSQITSVQDLIQFFSGIPDDRWCVGQLFDDRGGRCAVGHICSGIEESTLNQPFSILPSNGITLSWVNDGRQGYRELGDTPKARVLAYLRSLEPASPAPSPSALSVTLATLSTP